MNAAATRIESTPKPSSSPVAHPAPPLDASTSGTYRRMQYKAVLSRKPENTAETGAGAWLWASGNQLCIGARPALVP